MYRREFLKISATVLPVAAFLGHVGCVAALRPRICARKRLKEGKQMQLGIVTYNLAKDWDLETIIRNCEDTGFEGVELRTTHAHGVEVSLTPRQRAEVRRRFENSSVKLCQLGSAFEFHSASPEQVRRNIEGTKAYVELASDVGAPAVKVRPNGLQTASGVPVEKTLEQIGNALRECGEFANDYGVQIRLEVHGQGTSRLDYIEQIMTIADHDNVYVNWNSNDTDLAHGGLEENFRRVQAKIAHVHMRELYIPNYPWRELFALLRGIGYTGFCCAEIPASSDPITVMRYYRALFLAYQED